MILHMNTQSQRHMCFQTVQKNQKPRGGGGGAGTETAPRCRRGKAALLLKAGAAVLIRGLLRSVYHLWRSEVRAPGPGGPAGLPSVKKLASSCRR